MLILQFTKLLLGLSKSFFHGCLAGKGGIETNPKATNLLIQQLKIAKLIDQRHAFLRE